MSNQKPNSLKRSLSADSVSCPLARKRNKKSLALAPLRRSVRLRYLQPPVNLNNSSTSSEPGPSHNNPSYDLTMTDYDQMSTSSESEDSLKMNQVQVASDPLSLDDDSDTEISEVSAQTQTSPMPNENVAVVNSIPPPNETTNNLSLEEIANGEVSVPMPTFHEMMVMRYSLRGRVQTRPPVAAAVAAPRSNVPLHHSQMWLRQHREMENRRRNLLLSDSIQNFFSRWEGISEFLHSTVNTAAEAVDLERRSLHVLLERIRHEWISATPEMINNHTVSFRYTTSHKYGNQVNCVICLSNFQLNETMRRLPCVHLFHQDCIDRWLLDNRCCPICRNPICSSGARGDTLQGNELDRETDTEIPSDTDAEI